MKLYSLDALVKKLNSAHFKVKWALAKVGAVPHVTRGPASLYIEDTLSAIRLVIKDAPELKPGHPTYVVSDHVQKMSAAKAAVKAAAAARLEAAKKKKKG